MLRPHRTTPVGFLGWTRRSAIAGLLALLAVLAVAPSAMAGKPKGEYAAFNHCPLGAAGVSQCVYALFSGGKLSLGKLTVPIAQPITLQGGLIVTEKGETFVNTTEGQTLSVTAEEVPGGLLGLPGHESESSAFSIAMELVGSVTLSRSNLATSTGTALKLPVRVHLKNVFLGESCFVGTSASPITLNLTTGTTSPPKPNTPITGTSGEHESKEEGNLVVYKNDSLVENAFSVPTVAKGCGGLNESLIAPIMNSKYGWPAAAGNNSTVVLNGTTKFANAEAVKKSE
ncbi:MAG TPA: hypothetical protein VHV75_18745 [Solirubrobacteraceae bacterium]|jgi:hypothetical protein|nr:hypothetical protein [Solirubrobacteraceae bacterium]